MLNQKGQSIVGAIVSVAILGIFMLALTSANELMFKMNTTNSANSDIVSYLDQVRLSLQDPTMATNALATNSIVVGNPITILDPLDTSKTLVGTAYKQQPNFAWNVSKVYFQSAVPVPSRAGLYRLTIGIGFQKDQTRIIGASNSAKVLGDVYCLAPGGTITACLGSVDTQTLAQQICTSMGATWDTSTGICTAPTIASSTPTSTSTSTNTTIIESTGLDNGNHTGEIANKFKE